MRTVFACGSRCLAAFFVGVLATSAACGDSGTKADSGVDGAAGSGGAGGGSGAGGTGGAGAGGTGGGGACTTPAQQADPGQCFVCSAGTLYCQVNAQFCTITLLRNGGSTAACSMYPAQCQSSPTCACLGTAMCQESAPGAVTTRVQAP